MIEYITAITGLINMASGLSIGMLMFISMLGVLWILAWKSPELIKAIWKVKENDK